MPVVSGFPGIVIAMYRDDHAAMSWSGVNCTRTNFRTTGKDAAGRRLRTPSTHWNEAMFLRVTNARPLDGYRVEVCFDDEREGEAAPG